MPTSVEDKRAIFRSLHESGCFIAATPRNEGGLRRIEAMGAKAVETSAMGLAGWSDGMDHLCAGQNSLPHLSRLCRGTDLPVSVELHPATHEDPRHWVEYVRATIQAGVAGLSIADDAGEDRGANDSPIEHVRRAREVISRSERDIVLQVDCARLWAGAVRQQAVVQHLRACADAGADVFRIPATASPAIIQAVVGIVSPRAVSVVVRDLTVSVKAICALGVRRVSMGFTLGADQWSGFERGYATVLSRAIESSLQPAERNP